MSRYNYHQSAFKNGMVSSKLLGRTDITEYAYSARDIRNFLPAPMGGLFSRPGTVTQVYGDQEVTVIPWERAGGNYYITFRQSSFDTANLCFKAFTANWETRSCQLSNSQLNVFGTTTALPTHSTYIQEKTTAGTAFETLDFNGFSYVIIENALVLTHNSGTIPPLVFRVNSLGGGVIIEAYQFTGQLSVRTQTGPLFSANELSLAFKSTPYNTNRESGIWLLPAAGVTSGQEGLQTTVYTTTDIDAFAGNTATPTAYFTPAMKWTYLVINQANKEGVYFIYEITSTTKAKAVVIINGNGTSPKSNQYRRQLFNIDQGFPKLISSFNSRAIFANTETKPNWFFCSRTNSYKEIYGFRPFQQLTADPITEADSFELPLTAKDYSEIKWISQQNDLLIGTGKEEFVLTQGDNALSVVNIGIAPQSSIGGSFVPAIKNSESAFFVSADGKSIRQIQYNFDVRGYRSKNISILNDDIIYRPRANQVIPSNANVRIEKIAWQESNRILWILTNTANLFSVTIEPASDTMAWAYHVMGGTDAAVKDIFTFFSQGLSRSVLGMVVLRNDNFTIEFLAPEYINDSLITDSLDISDQPILMDSCSLISVNSDPLIFTAQIPATSLLTITDGLGLAQQIPTGKKFKVNSIVYPNADGPEPGWTVGMNLYLINEYNGYVAPTIKFALTYADAMTGLPDVTTRLVEIELEDAEPTAKYTQWGKFLKLVGERQDVIGDGVLYENMLVDSNGFITLPTAVSKVVVGYFFDAYFKSTTPDYAGSFGSAVGSMKRAERVFVRYHKTRTGRIGTSETSMEDIAFKGDLPYSGSIEQHVAGTADREFCFIITKTKSLPLNIMSVTYRGQVNE